MDPRWTNGALVRARSSIAGKQLRNQLLTPSNEDVTRAGNRKRSPYPGLNYDHLPSRQRAQPNLRGVCLDGQEVTITPSVLDSIPASSRPSLAVRLFRMDPLAELLEVALVLGLELFDEHTAETRIFHTQFELKGAILVALRRLIQRSGPKSRT